MKKALLLLLSIVLFATQSSKAQSNATLAADIIPGMDPSFPSYLTAFNGKLYFTANDNTFDQELYEFNGTTATKININATGCSSPSALIVFNSKLYFYADKGTGEATELMVYDGTNTPTIVADINPGAGFSNISDLIVFNGKLYFNADDGVNGMSLWQYDGIGLPAKVAGSDGIDPRDFAVYNDKLYFSATDVTTTNFGVELFVYDDVPLTPPTLVQNINSGSASSFPTFLTVFDNKLFFSASNGTNGNELWQYDGASATLVADINVGANGSIPSGLTTFSGKLYFSADNGTNGSELYAYDGFTASMVQDIYVGTPFDGSAPTNLITYGDTLYFSADDGTGPEIWHYGGTGTAWGENLNPSGGSYMSNPAIYNNKLYFQADNGTTGPELYRISTACDATASLSGGASVCQNAAAPIITFTGSNSVSPYTFSYRINGGAIQTLTTAGTIATLSVPTATAGVYTYTLVSVAANGCSSAQSGSAVVTVNTLPTASLSGGATLCQNATAPLITFTGANGTSPYNFGYRINGGAIQTLTTASTIATLSVPTTTASVFSYTLVSVAANGCSQTQTGSAVVIVNAVPTASLSGGATICQSATTPIVTFTGANATDPYNFTYRINGGSVQTITTTTSAIATLSVPTATAGVYSYTLESVYTSACAQAQTGSVVVTVNAVPTASLSGGGILCQSSPSPILTFTGANASNPYSFSYQINGGTMQTLTTASTIATLSVPTSTANTYTYVLASVSANTCSQAQTSSAIVTVNPKPNVNLGSVIYLETTSTQTFDAGNVGSTYLWSTGATTQITTASAFGSYTVTVTNRFGCDTKDTISIKLNGPKTIFVKADATGGVENGTSWLNAYTNLTTAIDNAHNGDTIFVAAGTYQPASGQSFNIKENVKLYGGFAGTESYIYQRNLGAGNTTILQGNNNKVIDLFTSLSGILPIEAVIDGFTITGGNSQGAGGIYVYGSPIISNCIVKGNTSTGGNFSKGGGIFVVAGSPKIINCVITGNSASEGGAIYTASSTSAIITNCIITGNSAILKGGAMSNFFSFITISNSIIYGNTAP